MDKVNKNWSYTIPEGEHKGTTLYSGRYCAICSIVIAAETYNKITKWYILANRRGSGTPDFNGYWNLPCGYIEGNEIAKNACSREVAEECGINIDPNEFQLKHIETNPEILHLSINVSNLEN